MNCPLPVLEMSKMQKCEIAIAGHNGVSHAVSHSGFVQDDSLGFAMLTNLLAKAANLDVDITAVTCGVKTVTVEIGYDTAFHKKGVGVANTSLTITKFAKEMMQKAVTQSGLLPQALTTSIFGRSYGHGICESASALNLAISRAVLDYFRKNWIETEHAYDNVPTSTGEFLAGTLLIDKIPVSWLLTINACEFGAGPNEDSEGTIPIGNKGLLQEKIGMIDLPTIILESKAYIPAMLDKVDKVQFFVRWNKEFDNDIVGEALKSSLKKLDLPHLFDDSAYPRNESLRNETARIGKEIEELGKAYAVAETSAEKVQIVYKLGKLATSDLGGSVFMSNNIFQYSGAGGLWPGRSAVLSVIADQAHIDDYGTVISEESELEQSLYIITFALLELYKNKEQAQAVALERKVKLSPEEILALIA